MNADIDRNPALLLVNRRDQADVKLDLTFIPSLLSPV